MYTAEGTVLPLLTGGSEDSLTIADERLVRRIAAAYDLVAVVQSEDDGRRSYRRVIDRSEVSFVERKAVKSCVLSLVVSDDIAFLVDFMYLGREASREIDGRVHAFVQCETMDPSRNVGEEAGDLTVVVNAPRLCRARTRDLNDAEVSVMQHEPVVTCGAGAQTNDIAEVVNAQRNGAGLTWDINRLESARVDDESMLNVANFQIVPHDLGAIVNVMRVGFIGAGKLERRKFSTEQQVSRAAGVDEEISDDRTCVVDTRCIADTLCWNREYAK